MLSLLAFVGVLPVVAGMVALVVHVEDRYLRADAAPAPGRPDARHRRVGPDRDDS